MIYNQFFLYQSSLTLFVRAREKKYIYIFLHVRLKLRFRFYIVKNAKLRTTKVVFRTD